MAVSLIRAFMSQLIAIKQQTLSSYEGEDLLLDLTIRSLVGYRACARKVWRLQLINDLHAVKVHSLLSDSLSTHSLHSVRSLLK
jgi:hypothetical protein